MTKKEDAAQEKADAKAQKAAEKAASESAADAAKKADALQAAIDNPTVTLTKAEAEAAKAEAERKAAPPAPKAEPAKPAKKFEDMSREEKIAQLQSEIAALSTPPFVEFPKMVKRSKKPDGEVRTFASRAEQDAAGPEWAD